MSEKNNERMDNVTSENVETLSHSDFTGCMGALMMLFTAHLFGMSAPEEPDKQ